MRTPRDLLTTWENWSTRNTLTRAMSRASTDDAREALHRGLIGTPEVDALDALRDAAELVALLSGWQWQAMHIARAHGASWGEVGAAVGIGGERARDVFVEALDRQEAIRPGSTRCFRDVV